MFKIFLGTKGLNIRQIDEYKYVIEDVFGLCSLPFLATNIDEITKKSYEIARTIPLLIQDNSLILDYEFYLGYWYELEKYYVARLSDYYRIWQCGKSDYNYYDQLIFLLPSGYSECGYGAGSREIFELIHQNTLKLIKDSKISVTEKFLNLRLMHLDLNQIRSDLLSVLQRAIFAFKDLLHYHRQAIKTQSWAIERLDTNEIIHTGELSYSVATAATIAVISLCTSLDLSSKLIHFINNSKTPIEKFKSTQGKHFSDLVKIKENVLSQQELEKIKSIWNSFNSIKSLIQFRHDLIHNTSALELEKLYIGKGTEEIGNLPMHYSFQPWRDCDDNGQPLRYLGREYFVSNDIDFEKQLCDWLSDVIKGHLEIGQFILELINDKADKADFEIDL